MNKKAAVSLIATAALVTCEVGIDHHPQAFDDRHSLVADSPHSHIEFPEMPSFNLSSPISASGSLFGEPDFWQNPIAPVAYRNVYPQQWTFDQQELPGLPLGQFDDSYQVFPRPASPSHFSIPFFPSGKQDRSGEGG
jgi:hypothetical protein